MAASEDVETLRLKNTLSISLAGLAAALIALGASLWAFHGDQDAGKIVPAILAPVLTVIGTLVGAVAGHAAGGAEAAGARTQAQGLREQVRAYERELPTETAQVREQHRDLF